MITDVDRVKSIPKIVTFLDSPFHFLYCDAVKNSLQLILPENFFEVEDVRRKLASCLPMIVKKERGSTLSFYSLSRYRQSSFKFFFEMISRWLVPGERLNVVMIYAVDFYFPEVSQDVYTLCEIMLRVDDEEKLKKIERAFPLIESELQLGLESKYHADKILEVKGLSFDDKTAFIHEHITNLTKRLTESFDPEVFSEMQHFLLISPESFKTQRSVRLISKTILSHYLFRKELLKHLKENQSRRKTLIKIFRIPDYPNRLGIASGMTFFMENEIFEERQLKRALQNAYPQAQTVEGSFILNRRGQELLTTTYIEIEKEDSFTQEEIRTLKFDLNRDLKHHVEHMVHPTFMPRNEEEIMRNILSLSQQLKYTRDLPQIFISFDQQSRLHLFFTIIMVRVLNRDSKPIQEMFRGSFLKYIHDRTKVVGHLRKKYSKEATVFRVKFRKEDFLRLDQSIDLYKARQTVVHELSRLLGEFRDYNGGMITKQNELFLKIKDRLSEEKVRYTALLLENFFYSLSPVIMQTILEPHALITLFKMLLDTLKKGISSSVPFVSKVKSDENFVYVLFLAHDRVQNDEFDAYINRFQLSSTELANIDVKVNDIITTGYIYRSSEESKRLLFSHTVESALKSM